MKSRCVMNFLQDNSNFLTNVLELNTYRADYNSGCMQCFCLHSTDWLQDTVFTRTYIKARYKKHNLRQKANIVVSLFKLSLFKFYKRNYYKMYTIMYQTISDEVCTFQHISSKSAHGSKSTQQVSKL
jgi:hypothetical protein